MMYDYTSKLGGGIASTHYEEQDVVMDVPPREIDMLTKRAIECESYANSILQRVAGHTDRLFGAMPEAKTGNSDATPSRGGGSIGALSDAVNRIERALANIDGVTRRLESL